MDIARIERRIGVRASPDRVWELLADLPGWDRWNPVETAVDGAIAFNGAVAGQEQIEGLPPRAFSGRIDDWEPYARLAWTEKRGLWFTSRRYFHIQKLEEDGNACIVANGFVFTGLRAEMFFDKHRGALRRAVDAAAESLKAAAEA